MTTEERLRSLLEAEIARHGVIVVGGRVLCTCGFDPNSPRGIEGQTEPWFAPHVADTILALLRAEP